jgi:hypothetical protein
MTKRTISFGQLGKNARSALRQSLAQSAPHTHIDEKGYVAHVSENLIAGVELSDIEADFRQGDGGELEGKFRAAHSSSALAANTFGPFKRGIEDLVIFHNAGFKTLQFERKCPHGLAGRRPPNLDLVLESGTGVIGVESKCLEYFSSKDADFADAYEEEIKDERREGPWFAHMQVLRSAPDLYRSLDAAQLIKHAFGLARTFAGQNVHLLYLFWEPRNSDDFGHFRAHRDEAEQFAAAISGGSPTFSFATYDELWRQWERTAPPPWLKTHVARLRTRYDIAI